MSRFWLACLLCVVVILCTVTVVSADYTLTSLVARAYGWEGTLTLSKAGPYGKDIPSLRLSVWFETEHRLRVTLRDANARRWEIPADMLLIPSLNPPTSAPPTSLYTFTASSVGTPFGFSITRTSTGEVIFNTIGQPFFFEDQFLQLGSTLPPNANVYGIGERIIPFRLPANDYAIWNEDRGNPTFQNLYGHHPIYHRVEDSGLAHAVILWNSNMMAVNLTEGFITYRTIGGILDFYFLLGPTPLSLTTQYTEMVGRPFMPPRFAVGWHQCKWGYSSANYTKEVVLNYTAAGIPLDVIWNDIDYMRDYVFGTFNDELGSGGFKVADVAALNEYVASVHRHHIYIVDPNIAAILQDKDGKPYLPYTTGKEMGIFVRHPANDTLLFGKQWPPMTVAWPDWTNPGAVAWHRENIRRWGALAGMPSGIWLDMNEPSNFCDGQITDGCQGSKDSTRVLDPDAVPHAPVSSPTDIPMPTWWPGMSYQTIEGKGFNMSSHLYAGQHYNVKEFWGMSEQRTVAMAMEQLTNTRAFTLSRSTFMGSGRWGAHWLGDNGSSWDHLLWSIAEVLSMGIYGITMVGADVCGFGGDTTPELCARWIQLGALYPFARDHSSIGTRDQEAYRFGEPYVSINRNSINLRYNLLPYIYSLYVESHLLGYPIWRALVQEFPHDASTYAIDTQFMLGPALLGIPILTESATTVTGYLPNADWFNAYDGSRITKYTAGGMGTKYTFTDVLNSTAHIPLVIRGGYIVPRQVPSLTTYETVLNPLTLDIALNSSDYRAYGTLVLDDGQSIGNIQAGDYWRIDYIARFTKSGTAYTGTVVQRTVIRGSTDITQLYIHRIGLTGLDLTAVPASPTLTVSGKTVPLTGAVIHVLNGVWVLDVTDHTVTNIPINMDWTLTFGAGAEADSHTEVEPDVDADEAMQHRHERPTLLQ